MEGAWSSEIILHLDLKGYTPPFRSFSDKTESHYSVISLPSFTHQFCAVSQSLPSSSHSQTCSPLSQPSLAHLPDPHSRIQLSVSHTHPGPATYCYVHGYPPRMSPVSRMSQQGRHKCYRQKLQMWHCGGHKHQNSSHTTKIRHVLHCVYCIYKLIEHTRNVTWMITAVIFVAARLWHLLRMWNSDFEL